MQKLFIDFLGDKVKKNFIFTNNLNINQKFFNNKKNILNLIISKSGNTLETIANVNILIKKCDKIFLLLKIKIRYQKI